VIFDVDDFFEGHDRMDLLLELKAANPDFRMTAFAVPAFCSDSYLESLPNWIEVAAHGWDHGGRDCVNADEAKDWTYEESLDALLAVPGRFVDGFKAPGWQISDGTYLALEELGWWVADQHYNDDRRPRSLAVHCEGDGDHIHTHAQDVCGNGLAETFESLLDRVRNAESFEFVSEAARMVPA
jgi:hypothetical protein